MRGLPLRSLSEPVRASSGAPDLYAHINHAFHPGCHCLSCPTPIRTAVVPPMKMMKAGERGFYWDRLNQVRLSCSDYV